MGVQMFDPFITLAQHILWCKEWMRNSLFLKNVTLNAKGSESLPTHYFFTQKQRKRPYTATL